MAQKTMPPSDWMRLLHPEKDAGYTHFASAAEHPFRFAARAFEPVNAWWLADAALLAYWDDATAQERFAGAGLPRFQAIGGDPAFGALTATHGFVAANDNFIIVTFRGTRSTEWRDLLTDGRFAPEPWGQSQDGARVHAGFQAAFESVAPAVEASLAAFREQARAASGGAAPTVWFTGHSLGAALATLAADRFAELTQGVYTFGSPAVGNTEFQRGFEARLAGKSWRYVNNNDLVPQVPPEGPLGYAHVAQLNRIDAIGALAAPPDLLHQLWADMLGGAANVADTIEAMTRGSLTGVPPDFLADHTPSHYAIRAWNLYDA